MNKIITDDVEKISIYCFFVGDLPRCMLELYILVCKMDKWIFMEDNSEEIDAAGVSYPIKTVWID
jgi:hypothetical protein